MNVDIAPDEQSCWSVTVSLLAQLKQQINNSYFFTLQLFIYCSFLYKKVKHNENMKLVLSAFYSPSHDV